MKKKLTGDDEDDEEEDQPPLEGEEQTSPAMERFVRFIGTDYPIPYTCRHNVSTFKN